MAIHSLYLRLVKLTRICNGHAWATITSRADCAKSGDGEEEEEEKEEEDEGEEEKEYK